MPRHWWETAPPKNGDLELAAAASGAANGVSEAVVNERTDTSRTIASNVEASSLTPSQRAPSKAPAAVDTITVDDAATAKEVDRPNTTEKIPAVSPTVMTAKVADDKMSNYVHIACQSSQILL